MTLLMTSTGMSIFPSLCFTKLLCWRRNRFASRSVVLPLHRCKTFFSWPFVAAWNSQAFAPMCFALGWRFCLRSSAHRISERLPVRMNSTGVSHRSTVRARHEFSFARSAFGDSPATLSGLNYVRPTFSGFQRVFGRGPLYPVQGWLTDRRGGTAIDQNL